MMRVFGRISSSALAAVCLTACLDGGGGGPAGSEPDSGVPAELRCDGGVALTLDELHQQVISSACATCHHTGAMGTPPDMSTADVAFASIVGVVSPRYAGTAGTLEIVDPGAPHNSTVMLKVLGGDAKGFAGPNGEAVGGPMPQVGTLSTSQKKAILDWICAGAQR